MDVELLRQLGQRLLALDGGQSHLCFESRAVIPARSSRHRLSCSRAILAAVRQKLHLSTCPNLPSQLCATLLGEPYIRGGGSEAESCLRWRGRGAPRSRCCLTARGPGRRELWCLRALFYRESLSP